MPRVNKTGTIKRRCQVLGAAAVSRVDPHRVESRGEGLAAHPDHVMRSGASLQPVEQEDSRVIGEPARLPGRLGEELSFRSQIDLGRLP
jgi:hypothetical protein